MAKDEANQNAQNAPDEAPRVYKASEVHKRRAEPSAAGKPKAARRLLGKPAPDTAPADKSAGEAPPEESAGDQPSAGELAGEGPAGGSQAGERFADGKSAAEYPAGGKPIDEDTAGGKPVGEGPADGSLAGEGPASEEPADGSPTDEGSADGEPADGEPADGEPKRKPWKLVVGIVLGIVVAALLVLAGYVAGSRWVRFNDEADMQGNWYVYGTDVPLAFADGEIVINDNTAYAYHIDPTAKTIEYTFGGMAGQGRYWFSGDRKTLVITDGRDYTMWNTLLDDLSYDLSCLFGRTDLPTADTSIVLTRSIVKAPAPAAETPASEPSGSSSASAGEESTEMLKVSDIMLDEENGSEGEG